MAEVHREEAEEEGLGEVRIRVPRLVPQETRRHLRAARKEVLLAARSVIDDIIAAIDRGEERRAARRAPREKKGSENAPRRRATPPS